LRSRPPTERNEASGPRSRPKPEWSSGIAPKFKQGFGRLIRSSTDRGVVVVLDRRVVTKHYGRSFLRSLPPARLFRGPAAEVLRELEGFFAGSAGGRIIAPE